MVDKKEIGTTYAVNEWPFMIYFIDEREGKGVFKGLDWKGDESTGRVMGIGTRIIK